ncbi:MAG TPA: N-acetylmuramoyl-L-alanine amidase [Candidatus Binataceae bacterium]|nr:N-acetylmuramoyl-L-alanine amidase [Candidatus Binataceae bacterium]
MRRAIAIVALAAAIGVILAAPAIAARTPALESARIERSGQAVEMRFGFRPIAPRWHLSTHGNELWIEIGRARIEIPPRPFFGSETAPVRTVRAIDTGDGHARIVVEVEGKSDYAIARLNHTIVLRFARVGAVPNLAAPLLARDEYGASPKPRRETPAIPETSVPASPRVAPPGEIASNEPAIERPPQPELKSAPPAVEQPAPSPEIRDADASLQSAPGHPLVMIDPGHGGYDPGTSSASGLVEKYLSLQIAQRLRDALDARGVRAELTRSTDVFVPLPERTRMANREDAELFVSIHLNSSPNPETAGIEVYYLNNTTDRATIRLARMENGGTSAAPYGTPDGANLNYILADLRQQYKAAESSSLARMIDAQTVADLNAKLGLDVNALGARMGPFWVLVGAHMPAVLVECGFLSNRSEAGRLASSQYQDTLAEGIATAVVHFLNADAAVGDL